MMLTRKRPSPSAPAKQRINWAKLFWMLRGTLTLIGGVIMIVMLLMTVVSPWIVPGTIRTRWI